MTRQRPVLAMAIFAIVTLAACGGGTSTSPTPAPGPAPNGVSVLTSSPMRYIGPDGKEFHLDGVTVKTSYETTTVSSGGTFKYYSNDTAITITKAGYYGPYETAYIAGRTDYRLPVAPDPALTEEFNKQLLHGDPSGWKNPTTQMVGTMVPVPTTFYMTSAFPQEIVDRFEKRVIAHAAAYGIVAKFSRNGVVAQGTLGCPVVLNSSAQFVATTTTGAVDGVINSCKMEFNAVENMDDHTIDHELSHSSGKWHFNGKGSTGNQWDPTKPGHSATEIAANLLALSMAPGSAYTYNDRGKYPATSFTASLGAPRVMGFTGVVTFDAEK